MAESRIGNELDEAIEHADEIAEKVARRGKRVWRQDQYIFVFGLILASILSTAFLGNNTFGMIVTLLLMIATLVVALRTSGAGPRIQLLATVTSIAALLLIFVAIFTHHLLTAQLAYAIVMIVLVLATPYVIGKRIASHPTISIETITGAADIYLLIGLFFATLFGLIGLLVHTDGQTAAQGFLVASRPIVPGDLIYFSFTTLTTVGYGDLTASTEIGRMLSITEALMGQLYLVTVVAVLVSNMGRTRQLKADGSAEPLLERED